MWTRISATAVGCRNGAKVATRNGWIVDDPVSKTKKKRISPQSDNLLINEEMAYVVIQVLESVDC